MAVSVYHFEREMLDFATGATMMGFTIGLASFPSLTGHVFEHFGFSQSMLIFTPFMLLHLCGVATYSQAEQKVATETKTEGKILRDSLYNIFTDARVSLFESAHEV